MSGLERVWAGSAILFVLIGCLGLYLRMPVELDRGDRSGGVTKGAFLTAPDAMPDLEKLSETGKRNLFGSEQVRSTAQPDGKYEGAILERYRLSGVILSGQKKLVLLQSLETGSMVRLIEGDKVDLWTLAKIGKGRLVFTHDGENRVYEIGDRR